MLLTQTVGKHQLRSFDTSPALTHLRVFQKTLLGQALQTIDSSAMASTALNLPEILGFGSHRPKGSALVGDKPYNPTHD
jgi:hypothetical protein